MDFVFAEKCRYFMCSLYKDAIRTSLVPISNPNSKTFHWVDSLFLVSTPKSRCSQILSGSYFLVNHPRWFADLWYMIMWVAQPMLLSWGSNLSSRCLSHFCWVNLPAWAAFATSGCCPVGSITNFQVNFQTLWWFKCHHMMLPAEHHPSYW